MESKIKLGYWGIRGRAQIPRLLLAYTGADWEDIHYTNQWFGGDKEKLGLDFPNIPYLIESDYKLSETAAICQYIIMRSPKHHELLGKNPVDSAKISMVNGVLEGLLASAVGIVYSGDLEKRDEIFKEKVAPKLDQVAKFIGDKDWTLGYLTYVDFRIAEGSHYLEKIFEAEYKKYPFLQRIREKFEALPEIKAYYEGKGAAKIPFVAPSAKIKF